MSPKDIIYKTSRGSVPEDLAAWHMTAGGEPMAVEDRCLRMEEIVLQMAGDIDYLKERDAKITKRIDLTFGFMIGIGIVMLLTGITVLILL